MVIVWTGTLPVSKVWRGCTYFPYLNNTREGERFPDPDSNRGPGYSALDRRLFFASPICLGYLLASQRHHYRCTDICA